MCIVNITVHLCASIKVQIFERCVAIQPSQGSLGGVHIDCTFPAAHISQGHGWRFAKFMPVLERQRNEKPNCGIL